MDWFQSDEEHERTTIAIVADAIEQLQADRVDCIKMFAAISRYVKVHRELEEISERKPF